MLAKESTKDHVWARVQVWLKVPLLCPGLRMLQVLVSQSEKVISQTMVSARVWAALQMRPCRDHRAV